MELFKDLPVLLFESQNAWHEWLTRHCEQPTGIWLKFAKKNSGKVSISYEQALEEALCFGWIDGLKYAYDADYWLLRFTPRGPKSIWSKINVSKIENLLQENRLEPTGIAAVESAKKDGRWQAAYDSPSTLTIPRDFQVALDSNPTAKEFFQTLNKANIYAFCWRIQTAKRPETRKARIEKFIDMLNKGEKLH